MYSWRNWIVRLGVKWLNSPFARVFLPSVKRICWKIKVNENQCLALGMFSFYGVVRFCLFSRWWKSYTNEKIMILGIRTGNQQTEDSSTCATETRQHMRNILELRRNHLETELTLEVKWKCTKHVANTWIGFIICLFSYFSLSSDCKLCCNIVMRLCKHLSGKEGWLWALWCLMTSRPFKHIMKMPYE